MLAKSPEPTGILYGAIDPTDYVHYVRLEPEHEPPGSILDELEPWRPLLGSRAEIQRNARRKWWETAWPRSEGDLDAAKVIALYRTDRGRFALDEEGEWKPGNKATFVVGRQATAPAANRRALLPHRSVVVDLTRTVKDPWRDGPVEIDRRALINELAASEKVSVRLDPSLAATASEERGRPERISDDVLVLRRGKTEVARVTGDKARLDLLEETLGAKATDRILDVELPRNLDSFMQLVDERTLMVQELLAEGRRLVEEVERLVCALYEVPDELTEGVVAHAVDRAARASVRPSR